MEGSQYMGVAIRVLCSPGVIFKFTNVNQCAASHLGAHAHSSIIFRLPLKA